MNLERLLPCATVVVARHEIGDRERAVAAVEFGAENRGAGKIYLRDSRGTRVGYLEGSRARIEKRPEYRGAVKARQAAPINGTGFMDESRSVAVPNDSIAHVPSSGGSGMERGPRAGPARQQSKITVRVANTQPTRRN